MCCLHGPASHSSFSPCPAISHNCVPAVSLQVEKLLAEVAAADGTGGDLDAHSRLLERVAGEVSRLTFQANRGKVRHLKGCPCPRPYETFSPHFHPLILKLQPKPALPFSFPSSAPHTQKLHRTSPLSRQWSRA